MREKQTCSSELAVDQESTKNPPRVQDWAVSLGSWEGRRAHLGRIHFLHANDIADLSFPSCLVPHAMNPRCTALLCSAINE